MQISIYHIYNRKLLISSISPTRRPKKENPKQQSFVPSPSPSPSLLNTQPAVFQKAEATIRSRHRYRRTIETSELSRPADSLSLHTPPHLLAPSQKRARGEGGEGNLASASSGSERNCLNERVDAWRERRRSAEMMKTTVAAAADRGGNN